MNLLALLSRTSSLGPGSATQGHGHLPLQMLNERKGILVIFRKGPFMEVCVGFFPFVFVFSFSSWIISHFHLESPDSTKLPLLEESSGLFLSGRQRGSNFQSILISMALCVTTASISNVYSMCSIFNICSTFCQNAINLSRKLD